MLKLISKKEDLIIEEGDLIVTKSDTYLVVTSPGNSNWTLVSLLTNSIIWDLGYNQQIIPYIEQDLGETIIQVIKSLNYIIQEC